MQVFSFHLMPYGDLDMAERAKHKAAWVVLPNRLFDPEKGHALYNRYLDELEYCEQAGFDGLCVNEHHQNAYGLMPSPVVMAAALSRRTSRAKIAILGNAFCLREHPLTLAEEHAMIDCITEGRLISGFVRGIGAEYYSMGGNPTQVAVAPPGGARARRPRLDRGRPVRVRGPALPLRIREPLAPPLPAAAPADLVPLPGLDRDHRVGFAPGSALRLSPDLQPVHLGRALPQHVSRGGRAEARLYGGVDPDRLGGADLCRRDRRAGDRGGAAAY